MTDECKMKGLGSCGEYGQASSYPDQRNKKAGARVSTGCMQASSGKVVGGNTHEEGTTATRQGEIMGRAADLGPVRTAHAQELTEGWSKGSIVHTQQYCLARENWGGGGGQPPSLDRSHVHLRPV